MLATLQEYWKALTVICAIFLAGATATAWALEVRQEVAANTDDRMIRQYEILELRRQQRPLSQLEWRKHCSAGRHLRIFNNCPRRNMRPLPPRRPLRPHPSR